MFIQKCETSFNTFLVGILMHPYQSLMFFLYMQPVYHNTLTLL